MAKVGYVTKLSTVTAPSVTPGLHASTHENTGSDEISVAGLSGLLADGQTPLAHKTSHQNAGSDEINVGGLSGVLADGQTPLAHVASHTVGGSDELSVAGLSGLLADVQRSAGSAGDVQFKGAGFIHSANADFNWDDANQQLLVKSALATGKGALRAVRDFSAGAGGAMFAVADVEIVTDAAAAGFGPGIEFKMEDGASGGTPELLGRVGFVSEGDADDGTFIVQPALVGAYAAGRSMYMNSAGSVSIGASTFVGEKLEVHGAVIVGGTDLGSGWLDGTFDYASGHFRGRVAGSWVQLDGVNLKTGGTGLINEFAMWTTTGTQIDSTTGFSYNAGTKSPTLLVTTGSPFYKTTTIDTAAGCGLECTAAGLNWVAARGSAATGTRAGVALASMFEVTGVGSANMVVGTYNSAPLHLFTNDTAALSIGTNQFVGIGVTAPDAELVVSGPSTGTGTVKVRSYGSGIALFRGEKAWGTKAAPTSTVSDQILAMLGGGGFGTSDWTTNTKGDFRVVAVENWDDSNQGTKAEIRTTPTGSTTKSLRVQVGAHAVGFHNQGSDNGQVVSVRTVETELTGLSGSSATATNLIPAGAVVVGLSTRITTNIVISGGASFDLGDGSDQDRWGNNISALTAGSTTDNTDWTITSVPVFAAAQSVVLTLDAGTFSSGAIRIVVHYIDCTAPTS